MTPEDVEAYARRVCAPAQEQRLTDIDTLARTMWGEARSLGSTGMAAVTCTVLNRLKRPGWWTRERGDDIPDDTVQAACRDPLQYSCWNDSDVNLAKLMAVTESNLVFRDALHIAQLACAGALGDITSGATNYHTIARPRSAKVWPPDWAPKMTECYRDAKHVFYR